MASHFRKIRIVAFLAGILGISLFMTWMLGAKTALRQKVTVVTEFSESVNGLINGSPVRYHGVVVGRISDISIQPTKRGDRVRVFMTLDVDALGCDSAQEARQLIQERQKPDEHGRVLTASQIFASVATGQKAILFEPAAEIDVHANEIILDDTRAMPIPSRRSMMGQATDLATHLIEEMKEVDIKKIGANLEGSLARAETLLGNPKLAETLDNAAAASASVRSVAAKVDTALDAQAMADLKRTVANVAKASDDLAAISAELRQFQADPKTREALAKLQELPGRVDALAATLETQARGANLPETAGNLRTAAQDISGAAKAVAATSRDLGDTRTAVLRSTLELERTLRELRELLARINDATAPAKE